MYVKLKDYVQPLYFVELYSYVPGFYNGKIVREIKGISLDDCLFFTHQSEAEDWIRTHASSLNEFDAYVTSYTITLAKNGRFKLVKGDRTRVFL